MTAFLVVNGFSGVGKTSALDELEIRRRMRRIKRVTTRRPRKGERPTEYEHVTDAEFDSRLSSMAFRKKGGDVLFTTGEPRPVVIEEGNDILFSSHHWVEVRKKLYRTAIPNPRFWPTTAHDPDVDIVAGTFGYATPLIQAYWKDYCISHYISNPLPMITVFISMHDQDALHDRLKWRCRKQDTNLTEKWRKNLAHWDDPFEEQYDHVIFNDGALGTCVDQLEEIAGFHRS